MLSYYLSLVTTEEDQDKVEFIYKNYYSFMVYTVRQVLKGNSHDVEDIVHSAIIKIIESLDLIDFSDYNKVKNLCGIIAKNTAKDHCKLKDNQNISLESMIYENPDDFIDPFEIVINKETEDCLKRAIRNLDDRYKDVCKLRYINELKEREIARILNIPENTVSVRIYRGKHLLREALKKEGINV